MARNHNDLSILFSSGNCFSGLCMVCLLYNFRVAQWSDFIQVDMGKQEECITPKEMGDRAIKENKNLYKSILSEEMW